jgi:hypothetical protein
MSTKPKPDGRNEAVTVLQEATQGLLYMSESDEPFEVVYWKGEGKPLDPKKLLKLSGHKPSSPVRVLSVDEFFGDLTQEKDWYGKEEKADVERYRKLLDVIKSRLKGAKVYRIGKIKVDIYILGQTQEGDWAGVKTAAVET